MANRSIKALSPVWCDRCQKKDDNSLNKATPLPPPHALDVNITSLEHADLWSSLRNTLFLLSLSVFWICVFWFLHLEVQFCPVHARLVVCSQTFMAWTALPLQPCRQLSKWGLKAVVQIWFLHEDVLLVSRFSCNMLLEKKDNQQYLPLKSAHVCWVKNWRNQQPSPSQEPIFCLRMGRASRTLYSLGDSRNIKAKNIKDRFKINLQNVPCS